MRPYRNIGFFYLLLLLLVVAGFTPRVPGTPFFGYFAQIVQSGQIPWVVHNHAAVALAWFVLLVVQAFLIRVDRVDLHRWLGKFSVVPIALFLFTALQVMKHFHEKAIARWPEDTALSLLAQSFTGLCAFVVFYFLALVNRRNVHRHVAYMVAAALAAATPGLARLGLYLVGGLPGILLAIALVYATLAGFLLHAKFRLGQPVSRSPYLPILALFLMAHAMDLFGSRTTGWLWVADKIVSVW